MSKRILVDTLRGASLVEILRRTRNARGLTQTELAELVGCSQAHVSAVERERFGLTEATFNRFMRAMDCVLLTAVEHNE